MWCKDVALFRRISQVMAHYDKRHQRRRRPWPSGSVSVARTCLMLSITVTRRARAAGANLSALKVAIKLRNGGLKNLHCAVIAVDNDLAIGNSHINHLEHIMLLTYLMSCHAQQCSFSQLWLKIHLYSPLSHGSNRQQEVEEICSKTTEQNPEVRYNCNDKSNQIKSKAFIVPSTVIKIHSNHGNIRHNRNKWKQKAYRI